MRHKKRPIKRDLRDDAFTSELHQHVAKRTRNEAPAFRQGKVHIEGSSDEEPKSLVGEPLGEKQLTDVDGIDEFIAKRLAAKVCTDLSNTNVFELSANTVALSGLGSAIFAGSTARDEDEAEGLRRRTHANCRDQSGGRGEVLRLPARVRR